MQRGSFGSDGCTAMLRARCDAKQDQTDPQKNSGKDQCGE